MDHERHKKPRPPLNGEALDRLALHYVGRYATTQAKLKQYLARKVKERGWEGTSRPEIERLAERFAELGYVNDAAFAAARASSLQRRGYGERRVVQSLRAAGIGEEDTDAVRGEVEKGAREAALRFAKRKRIGPFAPSQPNREGRQKAFAAMMRAGHPMEIVREVLNASADDIPDSDNI